MVRGKLYTIGDISLAAFVGSPAAGFLLAAHNLRSLGDSRSAMRSVLFGFALTLTMILLPFFVSESPLEISVGLALAGFVFTRWMTRRWLQTRIDQHIDSGGPLYSSWRALGIGLVCTMAIYSTFFAFVLLS